MQQLREALGRAIQVMRVAQHHAVTVPADGTVEHRFGDFDDARRFAGAVTALKAAVSALRAKDVEDLRVEEALRCVEPLCAVPLHGLSVRREREAVAQHAPCYFEQTHLDGAEHALTLLEARGVENNPPPAPADHDDYQPAKWFLEKYPERFKNHQALKRWLGSNRQVRTEKPSTQRLLIHLGDAISLIEKEDAEGSRALDRIEIRKRHTQSERRK